MKRESKCFVSEVLPISNFLFYRDINPHIPQYISSTPWYYGSQGPTLKHQRAPEEKVKPAASLNEYFVRGQKGKTATKFRKGACENCGAMTHKRKDCLERPRKVGAQFSGEDIAADELILPKLQHDFDGKRDRWNGYDPMMYRSVIEEHAKVEEAKRLLKEEKLQQQDLISNDDAPGDSDEDEDEKYADHIDMPGTKVDSKQRITVRNLRIREDTAKYLRNLDLESAYYDPKTRSMRDNPYRETGKTPAELQYAGDNFVRYTGDTQKVSKAQLFSWELTDKGVDVHLQAEPTKAELINKEFDSKKEDIKETIKESILSKYGGKEYLQAPPKELIFAQTEDYVEYSRTGKIIKGEKRAPIKSVYREDVFINNHTTVWGSFWKAGKWGYKCCHSFIRNSYCTGTLGQKVRLDFVNYFVKSNELFPQTNETNNVLLSQEADNEPEDHDNMSLLEQHMEKKKKDKKSKKSKEKEEKDADDSIDQEKLKVALQKEEESKKNAEKLLQMDERKRSYHSNYEEGPITNEEIEAYHLKRQRSEDPMAAFLK